MLRPPPIWPEDEEEEEEEDIDPIAAALAAKKKRIGVWQSTVAFAILIASQVSAMLRCFFPKPDSPEPPWSFVFT